MNRLTLLYQPKKNQLIKINFSIKETSVVAGLNDELREVRRKCNDSIDKLNVRVQTLTRENELLKHQLKKYVGAVQKLRDGPMAYETV